MPPLTTIAPSLTARAQPPVTPFSTSRPTPLKPPTVITPVAVFVALTAPVMLLPRTEIAALRLVGVAATDGSIVIVPLLVAVPPSPPMVMPAAFCASEPMRIAPALIRSRRRPTARSFPMRD